MTSKVKIVFEADGRGLKATVDGAVLDFERLGSSASRAFDGANTSVSAARRGVVSISQQLAQAQDVVVGLGKAWAGAWVGGKLFDAIKEVTLLNARYQELGVVMPVVGRNAGYNATQMNAAASEMQHLGISMLESRNIAIQLAQAQINLADAGKLARIAQDAAVVGNTNSSEALNHMIYGIKTGQIEVLRTIGINVNFEQSYKALAHQLGVSTEALSEAQKMQARENAVLAEGEKLTGAYEAAMGTAGKQMRSMARYAEDLKVMRGEVFNEALTVGVMAFVDQLKEANQQTTSLANNGQLKAWGADVADTFAFIVDSGLSAVSVIKMVGKTAGYLVAQVLSDNDGKTNEQIAAASNARDEAYKEDIAALMRSTSAMRDALAKRRQAIKEDDDKRLATQADFAAKSIIVQKAYANQSLEVQRAAQLALAKGMFPQEFPDAPKAAPAIVKDNKDQQNAYEALTKAIREKIAEVENELTIGKKLTEGEKLEGRYKDELTGKLKGLTAAQKANIESSLQRLKADEKSLEAAKMAMEVAEKRQDAARKEAASIAAFMASETEAAHKTLQAVADRVQALQDEEAAVALSQQQNVSLAAAVEMVAIARLKEEQARKFVAGGEGWEAIQREIDKRQELVLLMNTKDLREKEQAGWLSFFNSLDSTAKTTWTNVLEGSQNIWVKARNTAKSVFFDWLYQMTAKKWLFNLTVSASGGALPASASAGGLNDITSLLGSAGTVGSTVASWLGLGGATAAGVAANVGVGTAAGLTVAEATAAASAAGAAAGSGLMTTLAPLLTAAPYLAALAGVYALAKNLDHSGTLHSGGGSSYSAAGGLQTTAGGTNFAGGYGGVQQSQATIDLTTGLTKSLVGILDSAATTFGQAAGYAAATSYADDIDKNSPAWATLLITRMGQVVTDWGAANTSGVWRPERTFSDGAAGSAEYLAAFTAAGRAALNDIDMAGWARKMLDSLPVDATLEQLGTTVAAINQVKTALDNMGQALPWVASLSDAAVEALLTATGGIGNLTTLANSYYENFYTADEKRAAGFDRIRQTLAAVNVVLPDTDKLTHAWLRTEVEKAQALGESGMATVAALLSVNGAFSELVPAVDDAASAAADAGTAITRTAQDIAASIADLSKTLTASELDLAKAQASDSRASSSERAAAAARAEALQRDITAAQRLADIKDMTAEEVALFDLNAQRRGEIDAITAASAAFDAGVASYGAYFEAYATAEQKRALAVSKVTEALGPGITTTEQYRAEVDRLITTYGIGSAEVKKATDVAGDFATAFPEVATTIVETLDQALSRLRNPVRTVDQIAGSIIGLEEELFQAQNAGNTAALRDHILAGLTPDEQRLKEAKWAIDDYNQGVADSAAAAKTAADEQQRAAAALAQAAQAQAAERLGLQKQIWQLLGDTASIRAADLKDVNPANQDMLKQLWALQDQKEAADKATTAAEQMKSAWSSLTDSVTQEVRRIRDLVEESSGASYASLAAQFATATAQTRAGDQEAAKLLPGLSQSMLTAYEATATSLVDLQRVRLLTANSLETTARLVGGGITTDAPAAETRQGRSRSTALATDPGTTFAATPAAPAYGLSDMVVELRAEIAELRDEVKGLRAESLASGMTIAANSGGSLRLFKQWNDVGLPITTETDLVAVYGA